MSAQGRLKRIIPMLSALAMGLRVDSRGETWALTDELDLVVVRRRSYTDGRPDDEVGIRPLGERGLPWVAAVLEDVAEVDRMALLADAGLNDVKQAGFAHTRMEAAK